MTRAVVPAFRRPRASRLARLAAMLAVLFLAGCAAGPGGLFGTQDTAPAFRDAAMTPEVAREAITIGRSTKAEVAALLGPATVIAFDSGYEVWLYRVRVPAAASVKTEFVVLFAPSGVARKVRVRPPPAAPG